MKRILSFRATKTKADGDPFYYNKNQEDDLYAYTPHDAKKFSSFEEIRDVFVKHGKYGLADGGYEMILIEVEEEE